MFLALHRNVFWVESGKRVHSVSVLNGVLSIHTPCEREIASRQRNLLTNKWILSALESVSHAAPRSSPPLNVGCGTNNQNELPR